MYAMVLTEIGKPLQWQELPNPQPGHGEIRVAVTACGVCRTVSAFPGSGTPAAIVLIASQGVKIFVMRRFSPATRAMAASLREPSPTRIIYLRLEKKAAIRMWLPCSAQG
jgi:hypothetical protein